jgi:cobalt transporter subunit CbtA
VNRFKSLTAVVLIAGTAAGLLLFFLQHFAVFPLIERGETYEAHEQPAPGEWMPAEGTERTLYTAATTVIIGIGFAALLFGTAAIISAALDWRKGALWGLAAFVCVDLAPSFGLPPLPPGVPSAALEERQLWWVGTVLCSAIGLWLIFGKKSWTMRIAGIGAILLPHAIGAPLSTGVTAVPPPLIHRFAIVSLCTTAVFWIALGAIGGVLYRRMICQCENDVLA